MGGKRKNILQKLWAFVVIVSWVLVALSFLYNATLREGIISSSPRQPNRSTGEVIAVKEKGGTYYIEQFVDTELNYTISIILIFSGMFVLFFLFSKSEYLKRRLQVGDDDGELL